MSRSCLGFVQENGKSRPCKKIGNSVLANGYCVNHQYIAILKFKEQLNLAEIEVGRLERVSDINVDKKKLSLLYQQITLLKEELASASKICEADSECSTHIRDLLVTLQDVSQSGQYDVPYNNQSQHPITRLQNIEKKMNDLASGTSPTDAHAFQTSQEYELARRRQKYNDADIQNYQAELQLKSAQAESQERKFQESLQVLTHELKNNELRKSQADQIVESLQKRSDRCQAESRQVSGVYSETINKLKDELQQYKDLYNNMVGREYRVGKSVESLTQNERKLQMALEELKQNYETKMAKIRDEYAGQIKVGGTVLSTREEQLHEEVQKLKADLELALTDLKLATEAGKEAINRAVNIDRPYGQIAQELIRVNEMLQAKNQEVASLQSIHDKRTSEFAQAELRVAKKIDDASSRDRGEIQRLSSELAKSERKLSATHQEIVSLQTTAYELRRQHQNEIQKINNQLRDTQNQLMQITQQREAEKRNLQQQAQLMKTQTESSKLEHDFKFTQLKETLNENYRNKVKDLQDRYEANQLQLDQERRNMQIAQKQIAETVKVMGKQKEDLEKYRQAYDKKLADFLAQKESLDTSLARAQEQANQFAAIENDYKKRADILRQTVSVQRQRYEAQIGQLTDKLKQSIMHRNQIVNSLEKCNASRDSIVAKVNLLTEENARLKDTYLQMKSKTDIMRSQYEAQMERIRAESAQMQTDIRLCAQKLQDATLAHDHLKRIEEENRQLRAQFQARNMEIKDNEKAVQRLLQDRELEKQQAIRLQAALRECSIQKSQVQSGLENTNSELRDVKRMHNKLSGEIQGMAGEYQQALRQREADMARQSLEQEIREQTLQKQLVDTQARNNEKSSKINQLQKQKQMISDSLANTEYERARQIQLLIDAQRVGSSADPVTGKSNLLQA